MHPRPTRAAQRVPSGRHVCTPVPRVRLNGTPPLPPGLEGQALLGISHNISEDQASLCSPQPCMCATAHRVIATVTEFPMLVLPAIRTFQIGLATWLEGHPRKRALPVGGSPSAAKRHLMWRRVEQARRLRQLAHRGEDNRWTRVASH